MQSQPDRRFFEPLHCCLLLLHFIDVVLMSPKQQAEVFNYLLYICGKLNLYTLASFRFPVQVESGFNLLSSLVGWILGIHFVHCRVAPHPSEAAFQHNCHFPTVGLSKAWGPKDVS